MKIFTITQPNGLEYKIYGDDAEAAIFQQSEIESRCKYFMPKMTDVVWDVGAGRGLYTLPSLAAGADVYAFEPDPTQMSRLMTNVYLNGYTGIEYWNIGLMDKAARAKFFPLGNNGAASFVVAEKDDNYQWVFCDTGDELYRKLYLAKPDWIKIDTDGAELHTLKGMESVLTTFSPKVYVENHTVFFPEIEDQVRTYMNSLGYTDTIIFKKEKHGTNNLYYKQEER